MQCVRSCCAIAAASAVAVAAAALLAVAVAAAAALVYQLHPGWNHERNSGAGVYRELVYTSSSFSPLKVNVSLRQSPLTGVHSTRGFISLLLLLLQLPRENDKNDTGPDPSLLLLMGVPSVDPPAAGSCAAAIAAAAAAAAFSCCIIAAQNGLAEL